MFINFKGQSRGLDNMTKIALVMLLTVVASFFSREGWKNPETASAANITNCGGCHANPPVDGARSSATGAFLGSHDEHAGTGAAQYKQPCTVCHCDNGSTTATNKHSNGFINISGTKVARTSYSLSASKPVSHNPTFGTCSKSSCHSSGRTDKVQYAQSPQWGTVSVSCLVCHGGRNSASGSATGSTQGFRLSTTHYQHLKYSATATPFMNCNICHSKTATDAATLKQYTGVTNHANGTPNVRFTGIVYASITSYKTAGVNIKKCTNTACHGGITRNAWGTTNADHVCTHCHGVSGTPTNNTDIKKYAPGWGTSGIDTDGNSAAGGLRVGAHFTHLSSALMKKLKCNECHQVPTSPYDTNAPNHMEQLRYNSIGLNFAQASSAKRNAVNGTTLATFTGYTAGTPVKAATCSSVYCHGARLKTSDTSGNYLKPSWTMTTLITGTPANDCARCHGNPPTAGSSTATHSGKTATSSCNGCHNHVNTAGVFTNKALHINGKIEKQVGCLSCHAGQVGSAPTKRAAVYGGVAGAEGDDFIRKSRHVSNGTATTPMVTDYDCIVCHLEGDSSSSAANGIITSTSYHGNDTGTKTIDLRDVDSANGGSPKVAWPGTRLTATNGAFTATMAQRDALDSFCMGCHDSNGSSQIAVNGANNGLVLGTAAVTALARGTTTAAFRPFNTNDTLANANDTIAALRTAFNKVVDVKSQFNSTNAVGSAWASHHNLNQFAKRYSSRNVTNLPNSLFVAVALKETANLQTTGETTGMHCSDCHLNEVNAHGSRSTWYNLMDSSGNDTAWTNAMTTSGTYNCLRCHAVAEYSGGAGTASRFTHSGGDISNFGDPTMNKFNIVCLNCHGGYTESTSSGFGAIHGNNDTYTTAGGTTKRYRFMSGASGRSFYPTAALGNAPDWTTTTDYGCYTISDNYGGCTKHTGGALGSSKNVTRRTRPLY